MCLANHSLGRPHPNTELSATNNRTKKSPSGHASRLYLIPSQTECRLRCETQHEIQRETAEFCSPAFLNRSGTFAPDTFTATSDRRRQHVSNPHDYSKPQQHRHRRTQDPFEGNMDGWKL